VKPSPPPERAGYSYRLLVALEELGPSSQAALGRSAEIDRSDVVATLDARIGSSGRALPRPRRRSTKDRHDDQSRKTAALHELDEVVAGVQDELLAPLSSAERAELIRLLASVV
jgi:hypothetical protein